MKIAHVSPEYFPVIGGVGQVVRELAERQVKAGHDVTVFVPDWDKKKRLSKKTEILNGVKIFRLHYFAQVANFNTIWPTIFPNLVKGHFDIIHSHNFGHLHVFLSALASKMTKAKHIHTTHCPWSDAKRSLIGKIGLFISYNIFSRWALRNADKIIAITPWELSYIEKYGGLKSKTKVIPNGVSSEFFKSIKENDFKKKHNISGKIILFFGRLNKTKSPEFFVSIGQELTKDRTDITFLLVGPDEGMGKIVKDKIGNNHKIKMLPALKNRLEVIKMYQSAEVYVLPSYREGLPLTLFEAMACGLPIVATPVNGVPFEVKNNENGFLIEYGDTKGFIDKIKYLLDNKKVYDKISKENIKKSKGYDWDIIAAKTLKEYESALGRKPKVIKHI
ncbi:MAG: glycosyltransferase family 4 protein [Candidatus Pacearchaeota archaeon]